MAEAKRKPEKEREERAPLRAVRPEEEERREPAPEERPPISGLAIGGLALSIISFILPVFFALAGAVAGAILGWVALSQIKRGERAGAGLAWGAIIVGALVAILAVIALAVTFTGAGPAQGGLQNSVLSL